MTLFPRGQCYLFTQHFPKGLSSSPIFSPQRIRGAHSVFEGKDKLEEEFIEISQVVTATQQIHTD